MPIQPHVVKHYHVFLASPGDVAAERQCVRKFFDDFNRQMAHIWKARFEVIDWENYGAIGVGRPQAIITRQTLDKYRDSLVLFVGIMGQRFGTPSGEAESGTEEEFNWAKERHTATGSPEIKWFFRKVEKLELPPDPDEAEKALDQWRKVRSFRKRLEDLNDPVFFKEYVGASGFPEVLSDYLNRWLADPARPWAAERAIQTLAGASAPLALPIEIVVERYHAAVLNRFDKLNFEMLDTTGAYYSGVRLWSVFVPQSVRECHQYNPRLLEIPKEHQQRLLNAGEITATDLEEAERQDHRLRQEYFSQPLRPVLDVVDEALARMPSHSGQKLVILGDPGAGKSSLIRYLALRWARIAEPSMRDTQPIPLVIDLREYGRWTCEGRKGFVRFLEDGPVWHEWPRGMLNRLLERPGRVLPLLDGLDEVFDVRTRDAVINDIQRLSSESAHTPILVTSRVVGYQPQRLRDAEFRHFMLQDLDADQIAGFVDRWHAETFDTEEQAAPKRERLKKAIKDSKAIALLAGNPLLLTMMAILNRNQELPRDRADLYAQASRVLLHQWDTERALVDFPGARADVGLREKTEILRRVAFHMQAGPAGLKGNLIDGSTLTGLIEKYLLEELHFDPARAAARAVVDHLRLRNFILCFVGAESYAFVHRTFLEYFCAAEFVHRFNVTKSLDIDGLITLFDEHCRQDEWREVLRLICGQIDVAFVGRIVERLATRTDLEKWDGRTPLPELPLAIGCFSEGRNISRLEHTGRLLFESVSAAMCKPSGFDFQAALSRACEELGDRWPGKGIATSLVLTQPARFILGSGTTQRFWPRFCALLGTPRKLITLLTETTDGPVNGNQFRSGAVQALAEMWPDDNTRALLAERAVQDDDDKPRRAAIESLVEKWPDESTRAILVRWTSAAPHPDVRGAALQSLAEKWPDETTRALLEQRAVEDENHAPRRAALKSLAEKWPDETTRALLEQRAVEDENYALRRAALESLAEKWPDETTRALLEQRAVADENYEPRVAALQSLAEKWPDETTRALLEQRAVADENYAPRRAALQSLAEKWPDETTRPAGTAGRRG